MTWPGGSGTMSQLASFRRRGNSWGSGEGWPLIFNRRNDNLQVSGTAIDTAAESSHHLTTLRFSDLTLSPRNAAWNRRSRVRVLHADPGEALPIALAGQDVAGQAQTGTGKTAAFLVALYQPARDHAGAEARTGTARADRRADARARGADSRRCSGARPTPAVKLGLVFGGIDYDKQRDELAAGVDVLIGTPGRLIDYFKQHVFDLRHAQVLVLDEADRMFDLGFIADIRFILRRLPPPRPAPVDAVLRDAVASRARARLRAHEQSGAGAHRAGQDDGRPGTPDASTSRRWRRRCRC